MRSGMLCSSVVGMLLAGCSASSKNVGTVTLPTSQRAIDVVQHRSDVQFADCGTLVVLQTYNAAGQLIDSKEARGRALHCEVIDASIEAGGRVGAAAVVGRAVTKITNSNLNSQSQSQGQIAQGGAGGAGGQGGQGGEGGHGGNNGIGNGGDDGSPNGHDDSDR